MSFLIRTVVHINGEEMQDDLRVCEDTAVEGCEQSLTFFAFGEVKLDISNYFSPALTPMPEAEA